MNPHAYLNDPAYINAVESIQRVDEKGYLYHMDCAYDYYSLPDAFKAVIDAGCSTFFTKTLEKEHLLCRNYDYSHYFMNDRHNPRTGINVIIENANPKARYHSIGVADAFWLDYKHGSLHEGSADDGTTDVSSFVVLPFICMDGINTAGLGISIMALSADVNWQEIDYEGTREKAPYMDTVVEVKKGELPDSQYAYARQGTIAVNDSDHRAWSANMIDTSTHMENKPYILPPVLMRMILDNCATVEEGIAFADRFNIRCVTPGADYHIMIVDKSGKSKLLEWVDNRMNVVDINHATNYRVTTDDGFHGFCNRDNCLKAGLTRFRNGMREDYAVDLLKLVHQDYTNGADRGKTQYSCVYNLEQQTLKIFSFGDFSKSWNYHVPE